MTDPDTVHYPRYTIVVQYYTGDKYPYHVTLYRQLGYRKKKRRQVVTQQKTLPAALRDLALFIDRHTELADALT